MNWTDELVMSFAACEVEREYTMRATVRERMEQALDLDNRIVLNFERYLVKVGNGWKEYDAMKKQWSKFLPFAKVEELYREWRES